MFSVIVWSSTKIHHPFILKWMHLHACYNSIKSIKTRQRRHRLKHTMIMSGNEVDPF